MSFLSLLRRYDPCPTLFQTESNPLNVLFADLRPVRVARLERITQDGFVRSATRWFAEKDAPNAGGWDLSLSLTAKANLGINTKSRAAPALNLTILIGKWRSLVRGKHV